MRRKALALLACAAAACSGPALAAAPQPKKPIEIGRFLGKWYEIARTPNVNQKDCFAATMEWVKKGADSFSVAQVCRKGSPRGAARTSTVAATIADKATNAKMNMKFFGGLVSQEYWVIDRADDYRWAIVGTPGGNFVWLLSRQPSLGAADRAALIARVKALGYDTSKLVFAGV